MTNNIQTNKLEPTKEVLTKMLNTIKNEQNNHTKDFKKFTKFVDNWKGYRIVMNKDKQVKGGLEKHVV